MRIELTVKCDEIRKIEKLKNGSITIYGISPENNIPKIYIFGFRNIKAEPVAEFPLNGFDTYTVCLHDVYMIRDNNMYVDHDETYLETKADKIRIQLDELESVACCFSTEKETITDILYTNSKPNLIGVKNISDEANESNTVEDAVENMDLPKIKLHARVTKEIEISQAEADRIVSYLCGCLENNDISEILARFREGINSGSFTAGHIPYKWLMEDLTSDKVPEDTSLYLMDNVSRQDDIDL